MDIAFDIRLTHQAVVAQSLLTEQLVFKLVVNGVVQDIDLEFESVNETSPELLLKSKIELN